MKKSTKKFTSTFLAAASVAGIVVPATQAFAAEKMTLEKAKELIAYANQKKNFAAFNIAYAAILELKLDEAKQNELLAQLPAWKDVVTPDVQKALDYINIVAKNLELKDYDEAEAYMRENIKDEENKAYLLGAELTVWGKKGVYSEDVTAAVDAIIKVWKEKTEASEKAAQEAIAKVKKANNVAYLNVQLAEATKDIVREVKVESVKATGAKKIEVKFNKAVDTTKAVLAVKKGSVAVSTDKIEFSADKTSAVITTTTNLTAGDYVVTVSGLSETALTSTLKAENVKVAKINVTTQTAPMNGAAATIGGVNYDPNQSAFVNYEVLNQYGEAMTGQTINWTQSTGGHIADDAINGKLTLGNTVAKGTNFIPGTKIFLTGVHAASGTVVNAEVVVGLESKADVVTFKGVYNTVTNKIEALPAGFTNGKYVLLFEVADQYGNKMPNITLTDLVFTSNNPLFISSTDTNAYAAAADVTVDGVTYKAVQLVAGTAVEKGGSVNIQVISKVTGKTSTYNLQAEALATVKTFTMSAPEKIVAEGEKVEIPFTALDQYGNPVTKYSALTTNSPIQLSGGTGTLAFEQQNDGSAKLYFTANANSGATDNNDAPIYLTSLVTDGGSFSSLMVNVKETARPVAVIGLDAEKATSIAKGNKIDILGKDLMIQDQYGRVLTDAKVEAWLNASVTNRIIVTSEYAVGDKSPFDVQATGAAADATTQVISSSTDKFTITAKTAAGLNATEKLVFALSTDSTPTPIASSAKSVTFTKVDQSAYASYEVADLGTMYKNTSGTTDAKYNKTLKVYGVKADGTKVLLPVGDYDVTTDGKLEYNGTALADEATDKYVAADFKDASGNYKDIKVNVLVTVNDASGAAAAIVEKELLVSNKTPEVKTVTLDSDLVANGKATITAGAITNATLNKYVSELKDQYGVVINDSPVITITNLSKVDGSALTVVANGSTGTSITGAKMGDKFTATYKYPSGVKVSVEFTVGLDATAPSNAGIAVTFTDTNDADDVVIGDIIITKATDESDIANYIVTLSDADGVKFNTTKAKTGSNLTVPLPTSVNLKAGTITFTITVTPVDASGNKGTAVTFTATDVTP